MTQPLSYGDRMSWEYDDATECLGVQILEEFTERAQRTFTLDDMNHFAAFSVKSFDHLENAMEEMKRNRNNSIDSKKARAGIAKNPARAFITKVVTQERSARRLARIKESDELRAKKNEQNRQYYQRKKAAKTQ